MFKCGATFISRAILLSLAALLVACGGNDKSLTDDNDLGNRVNDGAVASSKALLPENSPSSAAITTTSSAANSSALTLALEKDTTPPSTTQFQLQQITQTSVTLTWDDATDNIHINTYKIERNGQLIATLNYPARVFTDLDLKPYTAYTYNITAVDSAGNDSKVSSPFTVRTLTNSSAKSSAANGVPTATAPVNSTSTTKSTTSTNSSKPISSQAASSKGSSKANSSKATSNAASSVKISSSRAASSASSNATAAKPRTVRITWNHPEKRENGDPLYPGDIGGYEIRYRNPADTTYSYVTLEPVNEYTIENAAELEVDIAVFDSNGIYSQFVKVTQ